VPLFIHVNALTLMCLPGSNADAVDMMRKSPGKQAFFFHRDWHCTTAFPEARWHHMA